MKSFRDNRTGICNIQFDLFAIAKKTNKGKYFYLIRSSERFWGKWQLIYSGKKTKVLNKYTLPIAWALFNFIALPVILIAWWGAFELVYDYFDGMKNFIRNKALYNNVRYFTWVTLIAFVVMTTLYLIK